MEECSECSETHRSNSRVLRVALALQRTHPLFVAGCLWMLYLIHPFIHGTPLDSGALDALLANAAPMGALYASWDVDTRGR